MSGSEREPFDDNLSREFRELAFIAFPKKSYAPEMLERVVGSFHTRLAMVVVISRCEGQVFVTVMLKEGL